MKITIEFETASQLEALVNMRDQRRDEAVRRISELEHEPLKFSLQNLADKVCNSIQSLTPEQKSAVHHLILKGTDKCQS